MKGWKVICPDGKERHFPYINLGDAEADALTFSRDHERFPDCPPGEHTVVPCVYEPPIGSKDPRPS